MAVEDTHLAGSHGDNEQSKSGPLTRLSIDADLAQGSATCGSPRKPPGQEAAGYDVMCGSEKAAVDGVRSTVVNKVESMSHPIDEQERQLDEDKTAERGHASPTIGKNSEDETPDTTLVDDASPRQLAGLLVKNADGDQAAIAVGEVVGVGVRAHAAGVLHEGVSEAEIPPEAQEAALLPADSLYKSKTLDGDGGERPDDSSTASSWETATASDESASSHENKFQPVLPSSEGHEMATSDCADGRYAPTDGRRGRSPTPLETRVVMEYLADTLSRVVDAAVSQRTGGEPNRCEAHDGGAVVSLECAAVSFATTTESLVAEQFVAALYTSVHVPDKCRPCARDAEAERGPRPPQKQAEVPAGPQRIQNVQVGDVAPDALPHTRPVIPDIDHAISACSSKGVDSAATSALAITDATMSICCSDLSIKDASRLEGAPALGPSSNDDGGREHVFVAEKSRDIPPDPPDMSLSHSTSGMTRRRTSSALKGSGTPCSQELSTGNSDGAVTAKARLSIPVSDCARMLVEDAVSSSLAALSVIVEARAALGEGSSDVAVVPCTLHARDSSSLVAGNSGTPTDFGTPAPAQRSERQSTSTSPCECSPSRAMSADVTAPREAVSSVADTACPVADVLSQNAASKRLIMTQAMMSVTMSERAVLMESSREPEKATEPHMTSLTFPYDPEKTAISRSTSANDEALLSPTGTGNTQYRLTPEVNRAHDKHAVAREGVESPRDDLPVLCPTDGDEIVGIVVRCYLGAAFEGAAVAAMDRVGKGSDSHMPGSMACTEKQNDLVDGSDAKTLRGAKNPAKPLAKGHARHSPTAEYERRHEVVTVRVPPEDDNDESSALSETPISLLCLAEETLIDSGVDNNRSSESCKPRCATAAPEISLPEHEPSSAAPAGASRPLPASDVQRAVVSDYLSSTLRRLVTSELRIDLGPLPAPGDVHTCRTPSRDRLCVNDAPPPATAGEAGEPGLPALRQAPVEVFCLGQVADDTEAAENSAGRLSAGSGDNRVQDQAGTGRLSASLSSPTPPGTPEQARERDLCTTTLPKSSSSTTAGDGSLVTPPTPLSHPEPKPPVSRHEAAAPPGDGTASVQPASGDEKHAHEAAAALVEETAWETDMRQRQAEAARLSIVGWLHACGTRARTQLEVADGVRSCAVSWLQARGRKARRQQEDTAQARSLAVGWLQATAARARCMPDTLTRLCRDDVAERIQAAGASVKAQEVRGADTLHEEVACLTASDKQRMERTPWTTSALGNSSRTGEGDCAVASLEPSAPNAMPSALAHEVSTLGDDADHKSACPDREERGLSSSKDEFRSGVSATADEDRDLASRTAYVCPTPCNHELAEFESCAAHSMNGNTSAPAALASPVGDHEAGATAIRMSPAALGDEQPDDRPPSPDRTTRARWMEPSAGALFREGSAASTAPGAEVLDGVIGVGEAEWARMSLSRTPPFDALNSPTLAQRWGPLHARARPASPSTVQGVDGTTLFADGEAGAGDDSSPGAGAACPHPENADSRWVDFFAPPHRMAPQGDACGADGFRSAEASASTTVRASSAGTLAHSDQSAGIDEAGRSDGEQEAHWSNASDENGCLRDVRNPVNEARCRLLRRRQSCGSLQESDADLASGGTVASLSSSTRSPAIRTRKRWNKAVERSRQYIRQWEQFLSDAYRNFDSEAQLRKRLSIVARAHPDVGREACFVALVQSRGRAWEAAAILRLPRAKDEAKLVTMIIDVASFVALAKEDAERRRLQHRDPTDDPRIRDDCRRREAETCAGRTEEHGQGGGRRRRRESADDRDVGTGDPRTRLCLRAGNGHARGRPRLEGSFGPQEGGGVHGGLLVSIDSGGSGEDVAGGEGGEELPRRRGTSGDHSTARHGRRSCSRLSSNRGSASAPALLPPLEGLVNTTPPSPRTLKTVLSTSPSIAVDIPEGFGLRPHGEWPVNRSPDGVTRRAKKASVRARARHQRHKMAEMSTPASKKRATGPGIDALTERFLHDTRALDRDADLLETRLHTETDRRRAMRRHQRL